MSKEIVEHWKKNMRVVLTSIGYVSCNHGITSYLKHIGIF